MVHYEIAQWLKLIKLKIYNLTIKREDAANWQYNAGDLSFAQISALSKSSFPFLKNGILASLSSSRMPVVLLLLPILLK